MSANYLKYESVRLPESDIKPGEIEILTFTAFGKIRYGIGVPVKDMFKEFDYHSKIVPYVSFYGNNGVGYFSRPVAEKNTQSKRKKH